MRSHRHNGSSSGRPNLARPDRDPAPGPRDLLNATGILRLQRALGNAAVGSLLEEEPSPVHDVIRTSGSPLGAGIRAEMEARLGADFSDVRVHTDAAAHDSAASVQAHAYTVGSDVVFGRGMYNPASRAGKTMLAHELTHVTQQRTGAVDGTRAPGGISLSDPGDRFERAAVRHADRVMTDPLPSAAALSGPQTELQRSDEDTSNGWVQRTETGEEEREEA